MKTRWGTLFCFLALPSLVNGQSLGASAEKERERREKIRQSGTESKTVTTEDLAANKGQIANDPGIPAAVKVDASPAPASADSAPAAAQTPSSAENGETYWRGRAQSAQARIERAQHEVELAQAMIRAPGMMMKDGHRVVYSVLELKQRADAADAQLKTAQKMFEDMLEEGRHAGALPGWLR
jgi:hypothetical protein